MIIQSHSYLSKFIYYKLENDLSFKLNKRLFKYGCIKPDISIRYASLSHYKDDVFDVFINLIDNIIENPLYNTKDSIKKFSIDLGVIIHFTADFFCSAHNITELKNNLPAHFVYENNLHNRMVKKNVPYIINNYIDNRFNIVNTELLLDYINLNHLEYLNQETSYENDLNYIIKICTGVAYSIVASKNIITLNDVA